MVKIAVVLGDITKFPADAIVNSANTSLLAGGGAVAQFIARLGLNSNERVDYWVVVLLGVP